MDNGLKTLKRAFGMREAITITVGTVIGVGLFTLGGNVVGMWGAGVIIATFIAMAISIYPALLYAEMSAALPYAGGTYKYASLGIGRPFGFLAGWNFVISLVAVTGGEALAFSFYFRTFLGALGIKLPVSDVVIACIIIIVFVILSVRGVEITGKLQNGFMFFFWGIALVWFLLMMPKIGWSNYVALPDYVDFSGVSMIGGVALIWWCFAGFETCCAMGEEIKYPHINIPRALFLAPFIVFAVNGLFQWFLVGIVPTENLKVISDAAAPYADAMITAGILGIPLILLSAGIAFGGDFSTLNSSISVPPRYLFAMARDGSLPAVFAKVHSRFQTPYVAIISLGLFTLLLVGSGSLIYIGSLSLFADLFYYVIGISAAIFLRRKMPDLKRPYRAPLVQVGAPISAVIYITMMTQLNRDAIFTGLAWCAGGLILYEICRKIYGSKGDKELAHVIMDHEDPPAAERKKMDREFKVWATIVVLAVVLTIFLYIIPFLVA